MLHGALNQRAATQPEQLEKVYIQHKSPNHERKVQKIW